jgi:serine/threonine protein kinase
MKYASKGNLRGCLMEITNSWNQKLLLLYSIINGLDSIHSKNLIHCDFHDGNILCEKFDNFTYGYISDYLGSYQFAKSFIKKDNIYGVIPFMAPEVLKGKPHTQASNIYSFSMIMWELTSRISPFSNRAHDIQLALSICNGERPKINENTPQCYVDLMKECWDEDPLKRPTATEILNIIKKWVFLPTGTKIENINEELKNNIMEFINAPIGHNNPITVFHPQAYYKSHSFDFTSEELNEILERSFKQKFSELEQKQKDAEQKLLKLETYFQNELQNLKNIQNKESEKKEDTLQTQTAYLQNEKQVLANNVAKQLEENKLTNEQVQIQISQLKQEKNNLEEKLTQTESNIQELKSQQDQYKSQLSQFNIDYKQIENKNLKLEIELKENQLVYKNVQMELINLQQRNSQFEQNNQNLKLNLDTQIKLAENLQTQITSLQNEKQVLANNLAKQLEHNKLIDEEKINLQEKLIQTETNIQELKSQQNQYKNQLNQLQIDYKQIKNKNLKLEYKLNDNQSVCQNIQMALVNLRQRNSQFEQDNQKLRLEIICLQNEKQVLANNLAKQLEQNNITHEQVQIQISQLKQEKLNLQEKLTQTEAKQESLIEQQKQLENKLSQSQIDYQQIEEKTSKNNMPYLQVQELTDREKDEKAELKVKSEEEIA